MGAIRISNYTVFELPNCWTSAKFETNLLCSPVLFRLALGLVQNQGTNSSQRFDSFHDCSENFIKFILDHSQSASTSTPNIVVAEISLSMAEILEIVGEWYNLLVYIGQVSISDHCSLNNSHIHTGLLENALVYPHCRHQNGHCGSIPRFQPPRLNLVASPRLCAAHRADARE